MKHTRREFLKTSGYALSAAALLSSFKTLAATTTATTASSGSYKALVCVYLWGGNDGNNMIIPYDNYAAYSAVRPTAPLLNIAQSALLPVRAPSQSNQMFGFHPDMPELKNLYQNGNLGVLCNTGTLIEPITRDQYLSGSLPVPFQLFSHLDQQIQAQSGNDAVGQPLSTGWGGRTADNLLSNNSSSRLPPVITLSGAKPFTLGKSTQPFQPGNGIGGFWQNKVADPRYSVYRSILSVPDSNTLVTAASNNISNAIDYTDAFGAALTPKPTFNTVFPGTTLGRQLQSVAQMIAARSNIGAQQQIFFVDLSGFDTHTSQLLIQGGLGGGQQLLKHLSQALAAFYSATVELGVDSQVTTFTLSDFGRTFLPNASSGSDHAWGNHQLIMGSGVKGGDFYGTFPTLQLAGPDDAALEGRWIPTTSIDQYAATLTSWLGLNSSQINSVFPNLSNFSVQNLGFLG